MSNLGDMQSLASSISAMTSPFRNYLNDLYEKYKSFNDGAIADYIPELTLAKPEWFGICVVTTDGQMFEVGECDQLFTIQSISKAFVFGLALEDHGRALNPLEKRLTRLSWMKSPTALIIQW